MNLCGNPLRIGRYRLNYFICVGKYLSTIFFSIVGKNLPVIMLNLHVKMLNEKESFSQETEFSNTVAVFLVTSYASAFRD